jgi:hypothetical protein
VFSYRDHRPTPPRGYYLCALAAGDDPTPSDIGVTSNSFQRSREAASGGWRRVRCADAGRRRRCRADACAHRPGAAGGIHDRNIERVLRESGSREVHVTGARVANSLMRYRNPNVCWRRRIGRRRLSLLRLRESPRHRSSRVASSGFSRSKRTSASSERSWEAERSRVGPIRSRPQPVRRADSRRLSDRSRPCVSNFQCARWIQG